MKNKKILIVLTVITLSLFTLYKVLTNKNMNLIKLKSAVSVTRTATFVSTGTTSLETTKLTCQDTGNGCYIKLPRFNATGKFSHFWSIYPLPKENLDGVNNITDWYYPVGMSVLIKSNMTFYPNFNYNPYNSKENYYKYRKLSIKKAISIGETLFEFEKGISDETINEYLDILERAYKSEPWLFTPTKVFVLTPDNYSKISKMPSAGVFYPFKASNHGNVSGSVQKINKCAFFGRVDIRSLGIGVSDVPIHELGHALDYLYSCYYYDSNDYQKRTIISSKQDVVNLYNSMKKAGIVNIGDEHDKQPVEWFANMNLNYYYAILDPNGKDPHNSLTNKKRTELAHIGLLKAARDSDLTTFGTLINKYQKQISSNYVNTKKITLPECNSRTYNGSSQRLIAGNSKYTSTGHSQKNAGTYKVKVTPADDYRWARGNSKTTRSVSCTIKQYSIKNDVANAISNYTYTGTAKTPNPNLTINSKRLVKNKDYKLTYKNNINAGTATVEIRGMGNYKGISKKTFKIVKANISNVAVAKIADKKYTGSDITPALTVTYKDKKLVNNTDYTLTYNNNLNVGIATVTITGKGNFTGTKNVTFNIISNIDIYDLKNADVNDISDYAYTGSEITPNPGVYINDKKLVKDTDYTLTYSDNVNIGEVTVTITGINSYKGTIETTFNIIKYDINDATINKILDQEYTGSEITPDITVSTSKKTLIEGEDYTVRYEDNIELGDAKVIITGINNYEGEREVLFRIKETKENPDVSNLEIVDDKYPVFEQETLKVNAAYTLDSDVDIKSNGESINAYDTLKTGDKFTVNGVEYEIVIKGDTNGDGLVTDTDLSNVYKHMKKTSLLEGAYKEATLPNSEGKVDAASMFRIYRIIKTNTSEEE